MSDIILYMEDFAVGDEDRYGRYVMTTEEIKAFARAYDPQPFHLDEAAGAESAMGVFCASGWHTAAATMRMMVDNMRANGRTGILGGLGIDRLRWLKPVVPGDILSVRSKVIDTRVLRSRPGTGVVQFEISALNQDDVMVMQFTNSALFRSRAPTTVNDVT